MSSHFSPSDLHELLQTGDDVETTVYEFGDATIRRNSKDDLTILSISGVFTRSLSKEIERLGLQCRGNLGLEFKDIRVKQAGGKKFDSSVLGLLKTLRQRYQQRGRLFVLCTPPQELLDVLKLTGAIESYKIVGQSSSSVVTTGIPTGLRSEKSREPVASPEHTRVHKRIFSLNQSLKRTASLEKGLDSAQKCVLRFLPQAAPEVEGYAFGFSYKSSEKVGGDFFDFIELGDDALGIVIGDVSGHGLDAALLMSISKKVLNMRAKEFGNGSPKEVLCKANEDLSPDFNKYAFVTALYGILEFSTGRFTFCRAGHEAPILFQPGMQGEAFDTKGMPLGTDIGKRFHFLLEEKTIQISPEDYLLLCTDGLAESRNEREGIYSRARLLFSVGQVKPSMTCREALHSILQTVEEFSGGRSQEDDITAILLHRIRSGR